MLGEERETNILGSLDNCSMARPPSSEQTGRTSPAIRQRARELRRSPTSAETQLWQYLRNHRLERLKFRRQHPIGPFIADFYCAQHRLVVEIDGGIHTGQKDADEARTRQFAAHGYRLLRFWNAQVEEDIQGVLNSILETCAESTPLPSLGEGQG